MPRNYNAPNSPWFRIPIRNAVTGEREEVEGTVDAPHLRNIGRVKRQRYAPYRPPVARHDPEYTAQCMEEFMEHTAYLRRVSELVMERRRLDQLGNLANRISNVKISDTPLIDRVEKPAYVPPKPVPSIDFKKLKYQKRQQELGPVIDATRDRIEIFKKYATRRKVELKHDEVIELFLRRFDDFYDTFEKMAQKYTNKQWRLIKRDVKAVKRIPLHDLAGRWEDVCSEFAGLGKQDCFLYPKRA